MFGCDPEDLIGANALQLVSPAERPRAAERMRQLTAGDALVHPAEYVGVRQDGTTFPLEIFARATDFGGRRAVLGSFRDLTERRRVQAAVQEAEEKYRTLVESSLAGVYIIQHRRFVYVNPRLAEIMGYSQQEMLLLAGSPRHGVPRGSLDRRGSRPATGRGRADPRPVLRAGAAKGRSGDRSRDPRRHHDLSRGNGGHRHRARRHGPPAGGGAAPGERAPVPDPVRVRPAGHADDLPRRSGPARERHVLPDARPDGGRARGTAPGEPDPGGRHVGHHGRPCARSARTRAPACVVSSATSGATARRWRRRRPSRWCGPRPTSRSTWWPWSRT